MKILFICEFILILNGTVFSECIKNQKSLICVDKDLLTFPKSSLLNKDIINLDLSKNNIRILYEDALEYFENLVNLTLDSNKIWKITNDAFKRQKKLEYLSLRNNALIISNNTFLSMVFQYLERLQYLDLSNNPLGIIPSEFFVKLKRLRTLYLEEMVKEIRIQKGALSKLYSLKILSLAKNNFVSLPSYMLNEFQEMQLESLLLHDNPWACDCRMRWFRRWFIEISQNSPSLYASLENILKSSHPMHCKIPKFLEGKYFLDQTLSKFECKPKILSIGKTIVKNSFENITISCFFESDPKSYVKWFKNGILIQDHWERIKQSQGAGISFIANLTIVNLKHETDSGSYICETTNNKGFARANFTLIIKNNFNQEGLSEYKNQQTLLLLIIVATGIIALIILVGIVIYCFYGSNLNNEIKYTNPKKSDLMFINDDLIMAHNSEIVPISSLSKSIFDSEESNDLIKSTMSETVQSESMKKAMSNKGCYENQTENVRNPIVKNFMLKETVFSNQNSDSDNHSCQLSIHDDCPIHGSGNSYNCPVHGSANELKEIDESSYNWNCVFNNKNAVKNNYYSLRSTLNSSSSYKSPYSFIHSYPMKTKPTEMENNECIISTEDVSNQY